MFYVTLPLSLILLATAHVAARRHPHPIRWGLFIGVGLVLSAGPVLCAIFAPVVTWLLLFTETIALFVWPYFRERGIKFWPISAVAVVAAYAIPVAVGIRQQDQYDDLRDMYPVESMTERVPDPTNKYRLWTLPENTAARLDDLDDEIAFDGRDITNMRHLMLDRLHRNTLSGFVNSPGFGVARMFVPEEHFLRIRRDEGERTLPGHRSGADEWLKLSAVKLWPGGLMKLHDSNVIEFVNPKGFGLVEDRKKVTGFVGHGYAKLPDADADWGIEVVELMGLLLHPYPAVYVSRRLPSMDELKGAPTRKPDAFESSSLDLLKKGDDLVTAETLDGGRMRMLGSIRNGKTCQKCHGGERGDLLGAFSYILSKK